MKGSPKSAAVPLVLLVVAIHAVAIWGIFSAREEARRSAFLDLLRETEADARSVEAALATLRGDFLFLSQSPPMARALSALGSSDPMTARWGRLDVEAALFLFFDAHPSVERVVIRDGAGHALSALGRRTGVPTLLPVARVEPPIDRFLVGRWPIGSGAGIEAEIDPATLAGGAVPRPPGRLVLLRGGADEPLAARVEIHDPAFSPRDGWRLVRRGETERRTDPAALLAARLRNVLLANGAVMCLALLAGALALRQVRRAARFEEEARSRERMRLLSAKLAESERLATVGRLAANLAHEINNPLEGVENYLSMLEEDLESGRAGDARSAAARVREGLDRIAGVVRGALGLARPETGSRETIDLSTLARSTAAFFEGRSSIGTAVEVRGNGGPPVSVDRSALSQLLLNLFRNASEAQGGSGRVVVTISSRDGSAVLEVEDDGPGIPAELLSRLFEPWTSTKGSTGLGLATSRAIAREHGGELRARNGARGAVLELELPLAIEKRAAA